jgi:hypothetical protein
MVLQEPVELESWPVLYSGSILLLWLVPADRLRQQRRLVTGKHGRPYS